VIALASVPVVPVHLVAIRHFAVSVSEVTRVAYFSKIYCCMSFPYLNMGGASFALTPSLCTCNLLAVTLQ
jgi:hypothetical protein